MKRQLALPPGVLSLCVVFFSLCLSLLALLTYNSAKSELTLAEASAANTSAVLGAEYACRLRVAHAIGLLEDGMTPEEVSLETNALLGDNILIFEEETNGSRVVRAELELEPAPRLAAFRTVYTGQWSPDTGLDVWSGQ